MGSITNRLERLEAAREPPSGWRTPEHEAERARRFAQLYQDLGVEHPPPDRGIRQATEELFALVAKWRKKNITRKEAQ